MVWGYWNTSCFAPNFASITCLVSTTQGLLSEGCVCDTVPEGFVRDTLGFRILSDPPKRLFMMVFPPHLSQIRNQQVIAQVLLECREFSSPASQRDVNVCQNSLHSCLFSFNPNLIVHLCSPYLFPLFFPIFVAFYLFN